MEHTENQLVKMLKATSYAFMIGCIFYGGGYGWSLFFLKEDWRRNNVGNFSIILMFLEVIIAFGYPIIRILAGSPPSFMFLVDMFYIFLVHGAICLVGSLIYLGWYLFGKEK